MLGRHIKKQQTYYKTFSPYKQIPVQFFTGSCIRYNYVTPSDNDIKRTIKLIRQNKLTVFIHSIYLINLASSDVALSRLISDTTLCRTFGFSGTVVHCGNRVNAPMVVAVNNLFNNCIRMIKHVTVKCPLILETSTSLLSSFEDFSNFYNRFTPSEKRKIKICIDTCHVFISGHNPYTFIQRWNVLHPHSIKLIHYNDAKNKTRDVHAYPGTGIIPIKMLKDVFNYCQQHQLPMIVE